MTLIICGFQGVGKSIIGAKVSKLLNVPFFDTDKLVCHKTRWTTPREAYIRLGSTKFREIESNVIRSLSELPESVISLGGGSLEDRDNHEYVTRTGKLIYLYVPWDTLESNMLTRIEDGRFPGYLDASDPLGSWRSIYMQRHGVFCSLSDEIINMQKITEDQIMKKLKAMYIDSGGDCG